MIEIEFSYIYDAPGDEDIWSSLMQEFGEHEGVRVKLRRMSWDTAWPELFSFTSGGKGPQVSHVGNTWVSSLARMNILRAFKPAEIAEIGQPGDFMAPNWQTGLLAGDSRLWAVPWTSWIYVVCYRKDLLSQAGIRPEGAFGTLQAATRTVNKLIASRLDIPWLNTQLPVSYRDLLHIASSWIWAAGGDFMDETAGRALFTDPKAIDGLKRWLAIYRAVPDQYRRLSQQETFDLFAQGRAAALLCNIRAANTFINLQDNPLVRDNLGVAPVTEVPWTGGGSFVIWDNLRGLAEYERAAIHLVKFLSSKDVQLRYCRATNSMPSRIAALEDYYPPGNPARDAVMLSATGGRGYYNMPIWRRVETQLSEEIGQCVLAAAEDVSADLGDILHKHLDTLAGRLNMTLDS